MLPILIEFRDAIALARRIVLAAHVVDASGTYSWPEPDRSLVVESAFLRVFIAWENFQERSFIEFLMGAPSAAGTIIGRYAQPADRSHAASMLTGLGRFVDWSTPESVRKLAKNFFASGEPFDRLIASIHSDLLDLKTIRNAAAHLSTTTAQPLDALASRRLQRNVVAMSAATFLLTVDPTSTSGETVLDVYIEKLDAVAYSIVHA